MNRKLILLGLSLVALVGVSGCASAGSSSSSASSHASFDAATGKFAPCPDSPNCVSTAATDEGHGERYMTGTPSVAKSRGRFKAQPRQI